MVFHQESWSPRPASQGGLWRRPCSEASRCLGTRGRLCCARRSCLCDAPLPYDVRTRQALPLPSPLPARWGRRPATTPISEAGRSTSSASRPTTVECNTRPNTAPAPVLLRRPNSGPGNKANKDSDVAVSGGGGGGGGGSQPSRSADGSRWGSGLLDASPTTGLPRIALARSSKTSKLGRFGQPDDVDAKEPDPDLPVPRHRCVRSSVLLRSPLEIRLRRLQERSAKKVQQAKLERLKFLRWQEFEALPAPETEAMARAFKRCDTNDRGVLDMEASIMFLREVGLEGVTTEERTALQRTCSEVMAEAWLDDEGREQLVLDLHQLVVEVVPRARLIMMELRSRELVKLFVQFDTDNDGLISERQCSDILCGMGLDRRKLVGLLSHQEDGIHFDDFRFIVFSAHEKLARAMRDHEVEVKVTTGLDQATFAQFRPDLVLLHDIFLRYDEDSSGTLSRAEVMLLIREFGLLPKTGPERKEIEKLLWKTEEDLDANPECDFREFLDLVSTIRQLRKSYKEEEQRALFNTYDKDRSGNLSIGEISNLLSSLGIAPHSRKEQQELALIIQSCDADNSGLINFTEFQDLLQRIDERLSRLRYEREIEVAISHGFTEVQLREFRWVFDYLDEDGSGRLEFSEVQHGLHVLQKNVAVDVMESIFRELDDDRSGELDFMEFLEFMRLMRDREGVFAEDPQKLATRVRYLDMPTLRRALEHFRLSKCYIVSLSKDELVDLFCEYFQVKATTDLHAKLNVSTVAELLELAKRLGAATHTA